MFKPCPSRILIADDDPVSRSSLRLQLSILGYLVVAEARDAREAVSLARQLCSDVVVMSLAMSNLDGLAACKHIDQETLCPIVLLCECSKAEWIQEACSLLAVQAYLVKPVSEQNLEPAIELALARFGHFERSQISLSSVA